MHSLPHGKAPLGYDFRALPLTPLPELYAVMEELARESDFKIMVVGNFITTNISNCEDQRDLEPLPEARDMVEFPWA